MKIKEEDIPTLIREGKDRKVIPLLYEKVLGNVEKYILKNNGKKDDAFDAFQDAIMVFYKQVITESFNEKYNVYGYIYRISINYWINRIKKDKRLTLTSEMETTYDHQIKEKDEHFVSNGDQNILKTLFAPIGEKCIELLTYTIYYNLMMEDVMLRMNFPSVSAAKMQQQRCKRKLIDMIKKNPVLEDRLKGI